MFNGNASALEILWTTASAFALLLHGWLAVLAWGDWRVTLQIYPDHAVPWERKRSALCYFGGQLLLALPQAVFFAAGLFAMVTPPPIRPELLDATVWFQSGFILAEWMLAAASVAFFLARRVLIRWAERDGAAVASSAKAQADHLAVSARIVADDAEDVAAQAVDTARLLHDGDGRGDR